MDLKHKEMGFLGAFEIFKETFNIINKNKKTFAMAALCFIHPLNYILSTFMGTLNYILRNLYSNGNISHLFSNNNMSFFRPYYNVLLIVIIFGYSIFSTAGVSGTVAALYTGQEPYVKDTISVVAKVWKRVFVTFLCVILVFMVYHIIVGFALFLIVLPLGRKVDETTLVVAFVFYFVGLLYLVVVLQLAGVVSVLEETCGFKAMAKSRFLLKEKMVSATIIVFAIYSGFGIFLWLEDFDRKMLFSPSSTISMNVMSKLLLLLLIFIFLLWRLVLETMFYFVCKSYHHESIDMSTILDQDPILLERSKC